MISNIDRHCAECGADQWNPPQGNAAATTLPITRQPIQTVQYTTHPNVVAGVTIIAIMLLFGLGFWLTVLGLAIVDPPTGELIDQSFTGEGIYADPTFNDVLSRGRVLLALVSGVVLAVVAWSTLTRLYSEEL